MKNYAPTITLPSDPSESIIASFPDGVVPAHTLSTAERAAIDLSSVIKGWGSDLDPNVRPGVPRDKAPEIGPDDLYINVEHQPEPHKILRSTEHMQMTPVFGTSCPPRGLSGAIRTAAFTLSEGQKSHWLLLMLADRVDMVEQLGLDLAQLKFPNVIKEMGLTAEYKYNRKALVKKAIIGGVAVGAVAALAGLYVSRKRQAAVPAPRKSRTRVAT